MNFESNPQDISMFLPISEKTVALSLYTYNKLLFSMYPGLRYETKHVVLDYGYTSY